MAEVTPFGAIVNARRRLVMPEAPDPGLIGVTMPALERRREG
jgi:hypothetical protein